MIKLKDKVNKSAIMRELHNEAVEIYKNSYEGEYALEQFLYGAEKLFEKLRLPVDMREFHCERFDFGRDKKCEQQCSDCHWIQTKSQ